MSSYYARVVCYSLADQLIWVSRVGIAGANWLIYSPTYMTLWLCISADLRV